MSDLDKQEELNDIDELNEKIRLLKKRVGREQTARLEAEKILEDKSRELFLLNQELNQQAARLEEALAAEKALNDLQRSFVSMASHEFRTPLSIIDVAAQKIMRRADRITPDKILDGGEKIRRAVLRMTKLMDSILVAARMEDGKYQVMVEECSLHEIILECCKSQQEIAQGHTIVMDIDMAPTKIVADPAAIEQVISNLLSNAVKYSPECSEIVVSAKRLDDEVAVSVSDRGLGIAEEDMPQMFGRFFRAGTSAGIAGTGIGLNLCKMLIEKHNGEIFLESKLGEGSSFTFTLPI